eukprot:3872385-Lingulodinium_polyedra.AAC.1
MSPPSCSSNRTHRPRGRTKSSAATHRSKSSVRPERSATSQDGSGRVGGGTSVWCRDGASP